MEVLQVILDTAQIALAIAVLVLAVQIRKEGEDDERKED